MSKQAKTRFVVPVGGQDRELFAVGDTAADGSLIIVLKETPFWHLPEDQKSIRSVVRRYSVHPSAKSNGTSIKYTSVGEGVNHEYASFINNTDEHLLWLMWFSRQWVFEDDNVVKPRRRDKLIRLPPLDEANNTLLYSVWVADSDYLFARPSWPLRFSGERFRNFNIGVYSANMPCPALRESMACHMSTSTMRENKGDFEQNFPDTVSYTRAEIHDVTMSGFAMLQDQLIEFAACRIDVPDVLEEYKKKVRRLGYTFGRPEQH